VDVYGLIYDYVNLVCKDELISKFSKKPKNFIYLRGVLQPWQSFFIKKSIRKVYSTNWVFKLHLASMEMRLLFSCKPKAAKAAF
jgi:hypothetical protein